MTTQTTQFTALVAALGSEEKARVALAAITPVAPAVDPRIAELVKAGFKEDDAVKALALGDAETAPEPAQEPKAKATPKEKRDALVSKRGFGYTSGRVYANTDLAEAIVRVTRGGKTEIVASSGVGRTKAVLVYREESGDVALQNLSTAKES